ncbi:MAG: PAS domain-containing protein [Methylotenera sp.]|nr:PAS domain-containing protein [Methylotenera sp.]MDP1959551.1 PAS domain-containing protein [Methylotenera sp.]MDP3942141.1 PAS domain-containing protein [Methylotenera sp.]
MNDLFNVLKLGSNPDDANFHQLHESLKLAYCIINSSTDGIVICEAEPIDEPGPRIVYVNETFVKETGYTPEEVVGKTPRIPQGPKTDPAARLRMREAFKNWQPIHEDVLNYKKNGEEFWLRLSILPIADETGLYTHWIAIQHDITERKNRENELLLAKTKLVFQNEEKEKRAAELVIANKELVFQTEEKLRLAKEYKKIALVVQTTTNAVTITDRFGKLIWVNPAFLSTCGYTEDFVIGKTVGSFLQGADTSQDTVKIMRGAIKNYKGFNVEILNYKKSGEPFWSHIIATPIGHEEGADGYVSIQEDISKQKLALALINQDNEDKEAIFRSSPNPMAVIDVQRHVSYVNPAFCQLFNGQADQFMGLTEAALDHFIQAKCTFADKYLATSSIPITPNLKAGQTAASTRGLDLNFEIKLDGLKTIERSYIDSNMPRISRMIYFQDATQKNIVDKMKAEFVATAAHELRTPMTVIFGYVELLKKGAITIDVQPEFIDVIHTQSLAMIHLLNDILDVAKIESQATDSYDLIQQDIRPRLQGLAEKFIFPSNNTKIDVEISTTLPDAIVDGPKLDQVLNSFLSNALKFSPKNGAIRMQVSEVVYEGKPKILIAIEDHGIGMTPEQLGRIFEKFYRADQSGAIPGTGLGMAISENIMEKLGGSIVIESEYGVGTKVMLYLPVA